MECLSHRAEERMSHSRTVPLLLLYTNTLHWCGWNSAAVITSVSSSMFAGLMSTMSGGAVKAERVAGFSPHSSHRQGRTAPQQEVGADAYRSRSHTLYSEAHASKRTRVPAPLAPLPRASPGPAPRAHAVPASCRDHYHSTGRRAQQDRTCLMT